MGLNNLLKVITWQRSCWTRTCDLWVTSPRLYNCATQCKWM